MNKKYVVFWMPTIFHGALQCRKTEIVGNEAENYIDLSDGDIDYPYHAKFKLLDDEKQIVVFSKVTIVKGGAPILFNTVLTLEDADNHKRHNGFVQFSFNEEEVPVPCRKAFMLNLENSIYHHIKGLYHEHECHPEKDNAILATISSTPINLKENDNLALKNLLNNFVNIFCETAKLVSLFNSKANSIDTLCKELIEKQLKGEKLEQVKLNWMPPLVKELSKIDSLCENVLIEYTYCKTLLSSIYNELFRHDVQLETTDLQFEIKKEGRKKTLNIRNSVRYIENIKYKNLNRKHRILLLAVGENKYLTGKINETLEVSKKWQRIGITLAIYSIFSTLLFGFRQEISDFCATLFIASFITSIIIAFLFICFDMPKLLRQTLKRIF